jgi:hypothetical protein
MRPAGRTRDWAGAVSAVSESAGTLAGKDFHGQPAGKDAGAPRFMRSLHGLRIAHWDHEPTPHPSQEGNCRRASAVLLPSGEGSGVGGFMGRGSCL